MNAMNFVPKKEWTCIEAQPELTSILASYATELLRRWVLRDRKKT
jgi:hypothetical protein